MSSSAEKIPVFLLKTKSSPHDGYEEKFAATKEGDGQQFEPIFVPVLEHTFMQNGVGTVKNHLQNKNIGKHPRQEYGGMIFTSQRAVEVFAKLVEEEKGTRVQHLPRYHLNILTLDT
jgi:uroporphyrinogen-III synthase